MKYTPTCMNELAYPYLFEDATDLRCDFEILTDALVSYTGCAISELDEKTQDLKIELLEFLNKLFDLNGSLRGKCAISEADIALLNQKCDANSQYAKSHLFVLPQGHKASCMLHIARAEAKKVVRLLSRYHDTVAPVDTKLVRYANLVSNYLFLLSLKINHIYGIAEISHKSNCY